MKFLFVLTIHSAIISLLPFHVSTPFNPTDNPSLYILDSLRSAGDIFPFFDDDFSTKSKMPSPRVHHSVSAVGSLIIVYGGYHSDGSFLGDLNFFHIESQRWSGPIVWEECCNSAQKIIDVMGLENNTADEAKSYEFVRPGFQGDFPLPRAEHATTSLNANMYLFGGITADFGIMQDFYNFNTLSLLWTPIKFVNGGIPPRRAGHVMLTDEDANVIYVFGGKGKRSSSGAVAQYYGMNDLWSYSADSNSWRALIPLSSTSPVGRQHSAGAVYSNDIYIFGGIDPVSNKTFNDLWVYRVDLAQWQLLFSPTAGSTGLIPPPLFNSHMIAVADSLAGASLLLYGGVSGGGSCGDFACKPTQNFLGQLYVFSLSYSDWSSSGSLSGSPISLSDSNYAASSAWIYGRLSTSWPNSQELSDGGKMVKSFALEEVVYIPARGLLYEFGGASAIATSIASANQASTTPFSTNNIVADSNPLELDSSGPLGGASAYWASYLGKEIQDELATATNGFWTFSQGFVNLSSPANNQTQVKFLRAFRVYKVSMHDLVLIQEERRTAK